MSNQSKDKTIEQLKLALDAVPSYVYIKDVNSHYIYANKVTLELFGLTEHEIEGKTDDDFFDEKTANQLRQIDSAVLEGNSSKEEIVTFDKFKNAKYFIEVKTPIYENDKIIGLLGISTDITHQKELEKKVTYLSMTDALTSLPNRRHLTEHFNRLKTHENNAKYSALLFIDLDDFKPINDNHGHDVGDKTLKIIARRLQSDLRQVDYVARLGGDEFVALLEHLSEDDLAAEQYAEDVISRIQAHLTKVIKVNSKCFQISASIGYALFNGQHVKLDDVLHLADQKMYKTKQIKSK